MIGSLQVRQVRQAIGALVHFSAPVTATQLLNFATSNPAFTLLHCFYLCTVDSQPDACLHLLTAESQAYMTLDLFQQSLNQSAALSACYALGMKAGTNAVPSA